MHWVRRNNKLGSLAALFALAIQLVVSFAHVHLTDFQGPSAAIASQQLPAGTGGNSPADDDDRGPSGHNFCAICAAVNLTSSSVVPVFELPAAPIAHPHKWAVEIRNAQISQLFTLVFQARAPPHSV
jgi:hypothetical protein